MKHESLSDELEEKIEELTGIIDRQHLSLAKANAKIYELESQNHFLAMQHEIKWLTAQNDALRSTIAHALALARVPSPSLSRIIKVLTNDFN